MYVNNIAPAFVNSLLRQLQKQTLGKCCSIGSQQAYFWSFYDSTDNLSQLKLIVFEF